MNRIKQNFLTPILLLCLSLLIIEVGLRLFGLSPKEKYKSTEQFFPSTSYRLDTLLGYQNLAGKYKRINNDKLIWHSTNLADGSRVCRSDTASRDLKKLFIYGCSDIYGIGLSDSQTFPWKLQKKLPEFNIKNFSTGGYNMLQYYLLLKSHLKNNQKPDIALVNFGTYYLERMVFARQWREALYQGLRGSPYLDSIYYPYASIVHNDLTIQYTKLNYFENPLIYYLSSMNLLNKVYNQINFKFLGAEEVNNSIIDSIIKLSQSYNFKIIFMIYSDDEISQKIIQKLDENNIEHIKTSLQNTNHKYDLYPFDGHPNSLATDSISERIAAYFKKNI